MQDEALDSDKLRDRLTQIMAAADKRDGFTGSHSRVVADLALKLATAIDVPQSDHRALELAGLAHDLGKMRVPEEIPGNRDDSRRRSGHW